MKLIHATTILVPLLSGFGLGACQSTARPVDIRQEAQGFPGMDPAVLRRRMEYMAIGEPHRELAKAAGKWNVACKIYMTPEAEPLEMEATAESEMILGGRFLLEEFRGEMMGQPFEGMLILGHDNLVGQYFSLWFDNSGTGYSLAEGTRSSDGTLDLAGQMRDAFTPQGRPYRHVSRASGPDAATVKLHDTTEEGTEWVVMEMEYTRQ